MASKPDGTGRMLEIVFPLAAALRANRVLRARRPELDAPAPAFRDAEIAHWQSALEGSPSLGAVIDQVYEQEIARGATVAAKAQRGLATTALVISILAMTVTLPAIGQMFAVSPWFLVAAVYAFAALYCSVRAVRLDRPLAVELDALADPIAASTATRGEAASGVLMLAVRARRAAAVLHNRVVTQATANLADASVASLRNALVAIALWMAFDVAPATLSEVIRTWSPGRSAQAALAAFAVVALARKTRDRADA